MRVLRFSWIIWAIRYRALSSEDVNVEGIFRTRPDQVYEWFMAMIPRRLDKMPPAIRQAHLHRAARLLQRP
ncbi:hypothetical protein SAMN05920897_1319 [Alkalispirochaeta americana]|uniref:Uncharacterized protein n=1 Tax=Alkalispirochaeta americana TaxID=159291 RepID=A0A1N6XU97_9SPIO|nr:hypothetical protein SAMN05920897_1319 [Alkalispirochaeta americana]